MGMAVGAWFACVVLGSVCGAEPVAISGQVMDLHGRPLVGANVWVWTGNVRPVMTTSTAGGSFRLEFEASRRGDWTVAAVAPGLAVGTADCSGGDPEPLGLRLAPEAPLRGRVLDRNEKPVPRATVCLFVLSPAQHDPMRPWDLTFVPELPATCCQTDAEGRFTLGHVPRGAQVHLRFMAQGFATARFPATSDDKAPVGGQAEECVVHLQLGGAVEGVVTHPGQPAPGVGVLAEAVGLTEGEGSAKTDENGRYHLEGLGPGAYRVMIDDLSTLVAPAREKVQVAAGETVRGIDFALTPGGIIEGRICDAATREPVTDVRAAGYGPTRPRSGGACFGAEVDREGRYRLRVAPGRNYIYYQGGAPDYPYSEAASYEIDVAEGQTVQAPDLALTRAKPVEVLVLGPDGKPVAGALVAPLTDFVSPSPTDAAGKCALHGLPPEGPVVVIVRDSEEKLFGSGTLAAAKRGDTLTVTLGPPAVIEVALVDPKGRPLAGVSASAYFELPEESAHLRLGLQRAAQATSDAGGRLRFGKLSGGMAYRLNIDGRVSKPVAWPDPSELHPGELCLLEDVTVDLTVMAVVGTVMLPDQTPVKGAKVRASGLQTVAESDADGRFRLEGLPAGDRVVLLAGSPDGKLWGAEEMVPEWQLEPGISLERLVRLTARLLDEAGKPLGKRRATLTAQFPSYEGEGLPVRADGVTDDQGHLTIERLVPGLSYQLLLSLPGPTANGAMYVRDVVAAPDASLDLGDLVVRGG